MFLQGDDLLAAKPDGQPTLPFADLDGGSCYERLTGDTIEHTVIRKIAFPTHFALFRPKALPGPVAGQGSQRFLLPAVDGTLVGGRMGTLVQPVTPGKGLTVQIIQIAKVHAGPKRRLHHADTALDLPFRLRNIGIPLAKWRRRERWSTLTMR